MNFSVRGLFLLPRGKYANNVILMLSRSSSETFLITLRRAVFDARNVQRRTNIRSSSRESSRYWHGTSVNKMQNTWELAVTGDDKRMMINMHSDHETQSRQKDIT